MILPTAFVERKLQNLFYALGLSIGRHPWRFIVGPLLFSLLCSAGFLRFKQINNARVQFTASDSPSRREAATVRTFLNQNGELHVVQVIVDARGGGQGDLLRSPYKEQLIALVTELSEELKVLDPATGKNISFMGMCEPYCRKNEALVTTLKLAESGRIEMTYPVINLMGTEASIGTSMYKVERDNATGLIKGFKVAILQFFLVHKNKEVMYAWEDMVVDLISVNKYNFLRVDVASDNLVGKEVKRMGSETAPMLVLALGALLVFVIACSFRQQSREEKIFESVIGGVTPIVAGVASIGFVSGTGLAFQSIVVATMFLLLAVGVDDVFIMLAAWRRSAKGAPVEERAAETLRESGCSMTITSVTNFLSFAIGMTSTTQALFAFGVYSCVAVTVCYFFQLFIFPAVLVLTAHKENSENASCLPREIKCISVFGNIHDAFFRAVASFVTNWCVRLCLVVVMLVYWIGAFYGITQLETDLSVQKLAMPNSHIVDFKNRYDDAITEMQTVAFIVQRPGDLSNVSQIGRIEALQKAFEGASYSYGAESTFCWLNAYKEFRAILNEEEGVENVVFSYTDIPEFLSSSSYSFWAATLHANFSACDLGRPSCVEQFLCTTGFTTLVRYNELFPLVQEWRAIAANFSDLDVVIYQERAQYADQSQTLSSTVWQTLLSALVCMAISFVVLIPDLSSILGATFSVLSVNVGVIGYLSLWGIGIDPLSMAALLMSIGFSVDITAHISYHYYTAKDDTLCARRRLEHALLGIGWPTLQGGLSAMIAMTPILFKPSYLGVVFLKTLTLVSLFGLLHGLVLLPAILTAFDDLSSRNKKVLPVLVLPVPAIVGSLKRRSEEPMR
ncbi:hypothetical protein QR680_005167 [Steinernema hermaphroditum]|uniref:SSD domain-containing protein n=1 Tax=Steinernema hermaphroditum TaxID=289476 RepID=A0AA39HR33_9BILA|nr:hypothetical protein QR680_005167 [Steinernema hermaphroditum]